MSLARKFEHPHRRDEFENLPSLQNAHPVGCHAVQSLPY